MTRTTGDLHDRSSDEETLYTDLLQLIQTGPEEGQPNRTKSLLVHLINV